MEKDQDASASGKRDDLSELDTCRQLIAETERTCRELMNDTSRYVTVRILLCIFIRNKLSLSQLENH